MTASAARIGTVGATGHRLPFAGGPGQEFYCHELRISHAKTTGPGGCSGCSDHACIVLNSILLVQTPGLGDYTLTTGPQQYVTWQGGASGAPGCPAATPARKATWGAVKALYH